MIKRWEFVEIGKIDERDYSQTNFLLVTDRVYSHEEMRQICRKLIDNCCPEFTVIGGQHEVWHLICDEICAFDYDNDDEHYALTSSYEILCTESIESWLYATCLSEAIIITDDHDSINTIQGLIEQVINANEEEETNNIIMLQTPVGFFDITSDDDIKKYPFSVELNVFDIPWRVEGFDEKEERTVEEIITKHNYSLKINKHDLKKGNTYTIKFSTGEWMYCDGDEHTSCYTALIDGWILGIGAYDPNDEKWIQWMLRKKAGMGHADFSESDFENYKLSWNKEKNGFDFTLIDNIEKFIYFNVAWIKVERYDIAEYEAAISFWIT